ncbi:MAG: formate dehydrogenase accessory sulfurtransferase FdhD [Terrimicrobiaceae bacterium]
MKTPILRVEANGRTTTDDLLAIEQPLDIHINGHPFSLTMRTPGNDEDLVAGLLFAEGVIESGTEIAGFSRQSSNHLNIEITTPFEPSQFKRNVITTSACGICGLRAIDDRLALPKIPESKFAIPSRALRGLPQALEEKQKVFQETGALHAAAWFDSSGRVLLTREDVGRHNAVDKLVGHSVREGRTPVSNLGLLVSGRVAFEIVQKAARAGVPFLAAMGAPTSLAVHCANLAGLTIVGFLRADRANVYSGFQRLTQ